MTGADGAARLLAAAATLAVLVHVLPLAFWVRLLWRERVHAAPADRRGYWLHALTITVPLLANAAVIDLWMAPFAANAVRHGQPHPHHR